MAHEDSIKALPQKYKLDGIDEDGDLNDTYHGRRGFTRNDRKDMGRMGKLQELRVSQSGPRVDALLKERFREIIVCYPP